MPDEIVEPWYTKRISALTYTELVEMWNAAFNNRLPENLFGSRTEAMLRIEDELNAREPLSLSWTDPAVLERVKKLSERGHDHERD